MPSTSLARWLRRSASVLLVIVSVAISLLTLELVMRARVRLWTPAPRIMDRRVGSLLPPNAEVHSTNLLDYDVTERGNSLGFLDRQPPAHPKAAGTFRVLVLGDSFVEALQVPIAQKFPVLLEPMLAGRYPGRRFETMALGRGGVGTAAELAYYETYGRAFDPDLVIIVFVNNDFADNSALLGAIKTGWHPDHPPWPVYDVDPTSGAFRRLDVSRNFRRYMMPVVTPPPLPFRLRDRLAWSHLAQWSFSAADQRWQWNTRRTRQLEVERIETFRREPRFATKLAGWRFPQDLDVDDMFFAQDMPPVFEEAEAITDHVLSVFAAEKQRHGFELVIAAIPRCSETPSYERDERELVERGALLRLERSAARHGLPVLDLAVAFARRGDPSTTVWKHDAHWNAVGHRWAAEALAEFVAANEARLFGGHDR